MSIIEFPPKAVRRARHLAATARALLSTGEDARASLKRIAPYLPMPGYPPDSPIYQRAEALGWHDVTEIWDRDFDERQRREAERG